MLDPLQFKSEEEYVSACEAERFAEQKKLAAQLATERRNRIVKDRKEQHGHSFSVTTRTCDHCGVTLREYLFHRDDRTQRCPNERPQSVTQYVQAIAQMRADISKRWRERSEAVIAKIIAHYDAWDANAQINAQAEQSDVAYAETMQTFLRQALDPLRML